MVTLDYLGGESTNGSFDKRKVKWMQQIEGLSDNDKAHLIVIIDAFIREPILEKEYNQ